jgi:hypothetical protein
MFTLINVSHIVTSHYSSLKEDSKQKFIVLLFFIIPLLITLLLIHFEKLLIESSVDSLITAFAIFTALLLNVIFIIYDIMKKEEMFIKSRESKQEQADLTSKEMEKKSNDKRKRSLIVHLCDNSLYSLLISIVILIILIIGSIIQAWNITGYQIYSMDLNIAKYWSFLVYILVIHFLINLLMITKRLSFLLSQSLI